jgi:carboxyl-terminal processing protease
MLLAAAPARAQPETPMGRPMLRAVLKDAFAAIIERHLEAAAPADMALWSLRGLAALDTRLSADVQQGMLRLNADDRLVAAEPLPVPGQPAPAPPPGSRRAARQAALPPPAEALSDLLSELYAEAWTVSPLLRQAGMERVLQAGFDELFNHLDPYSRYITAQEAWQARDRRIGQSGLGLRLAAGQRDTLVVAALLPDGIAMRAGLREGDLLLSIDGEPVSARRIGEAAELLEGPAGTEVVLELRRGRQRLSLALRRANQPAPSLRSDMADGILTLRMSVFSGTSTEMLAEALNTAFAAPVPPRGLVLDLRGNRGGILMQAITVADTFLMGGPVAQSAGRHPDSRRVWNAAGNDLGRGRPLVVLVDGRTASAAEIVAAALSDRGRAVVVGSATLGKGLIQIVIPLLNGAEVLISWSRVLAPQNWPVQGLGVIPAICTSLGMEALRASLVELQAGRPPMAAVLARLRAARSPVPASEVAALRRTCPPAEEREQDQEVARLLIDRPQDYGTALAPPFP